MIKVLVVDDSALMRREISKILESDPEITVVGTARDGSVVLDKVKELEPDVVTLDIQMPRMDGIEALKIIMAEAPLPVVMLSSLTAEGAAITIEALSIGAFDFVHKPSGVISLDIATQTDIIIAKIKTAGQIGLAQFRRRFTSTQRLPTSPPPIIKPQPVQEMPEEPDIAGIVGIGVSTGGPRTLMKLLPQIPADLNISILIAQHMPEKFTESLAQRINSISPMTVKEAEDGEVIERGTIYIAPGGLHMKLVKANPGVRMIQVIDRGNEIYFPSVDVLFNSINNELNERWLGIILTGMGGDGSIELARLRKKGGHTIAEAEETCTVFGMPKRAIERGGAEFILPDFKIPEKIKELHDKRLF